MKRMLVIILLLAIPKLAPAQCTEMLVKAVSKGSYTRGDIVVVRPCGWVWGSKEGTPKFYVVKTNDLSVASAEKYIGKKEELQQETRNWNKLKYDEADYDPFDSQPNIIKTTDTEYISTVSAAEWTKMQDSSKYYPYYTKPVAEENPDGYELTGNIRTVDVQGDVMTITGRRVYGLVVDEITASVKDVLISTGKVTVDWSVIQNNMENKGTGVGE